MLHSQAPQYCTAQRFNLFLATTLTTKAPMPGMALVNVCKGSPVNPFVLGCIACVLSDGWEDEIEGWDLFGRGYSYATEEEAIAYALQQAMIAVDLENFPELTFEQIVKVKEMYLCFVRFSQKLGGAKLPVEPEPEPRPKPKPKPIHREPVLVPPPEPIQPPVVTPKPQPVPPPVVVTPPPKWKRTVKAALTLLGVGITTLAIFIPDYIEIPLKALVNLILQLIG